jgi:serine phosphatase RsbU (regulator of sigma subunit)
MQIFKKFICSFILLILAIQSDGQSLESLSESALYSKIAEKEDTSQIRYLMEIADRLQYVYEDDSSGQFIKKGLQLADKFDYHRYDQDLYLCEAIYYLYGKKENRNYLNSIWKSAKASEKYGTKQDQIQSKHDISLAYFDLDILDSAIYFSQLALDLSKEIGDKKSMFLSYSNLIFYLNESEDSEKTDQLLYELIEFAYYSEDLQEKAEAYSNIASSYEVLNEPAQTLYYVLKAKELYHKLELFNEEYEMVSWLVELYEDTYNFDAAIKYVKEALTILLEIEDKTSEMIADQYNSIGWVFYQQKSNDSALYYFQKSKVIFETQNKGDLGLAYPLGNIGLIYNRLAEYDSAIYYSNKAMVLFEKQESKGGMGESYINIGMAEYHQGNYKKALVYLQNGLEHTDRRYDSKQLLDAYLGIFKVNKALKRWGQAIEAIELYTDFKDSLLNFKTMYASQRVETKLAKDKDAAIIKTLETKAALDESNLKQQRIINYSLASIGLLILISMLFIYRNWKAKKKAYSKLNLQHAKLIKSQAEIELQKEQIEIQHDDILASINFASRIQQALLKPEDHVNKSLPDHFVYFKPRDIVSGDFYWAVVKDSNLYLAAADCTGHGVPGAMMSMLGISFLNEIMAEESSLEPHVILDRLRNKVIKELGQKKNEGSNYQDGMDMSLIRLNLKTKRLMFAGANNPLWIFRGDELIEHKGEKQAICFSDSMSPFVSHAIELKDKDVFYLFSDGYPDQFGGKKGKKFMYKPFKALLNELSIKPMGEQKKLLSEHFEFWKQDLEQVDDVCVIGVRV